MEPKLTVHKTALEKASLLRLVQFQSSIYKYIIFWKRVYKLSVSKCFNITKDNNQQDLERDSVCYCILEKYPDYFLNNGQYKKGTYEESFQQCPLLHFT